MCGNKRNMEKLVDRLGILQTNMREKALKKDPSIIMEIFELDEIINELRAIMFE